MVIVIILIVLLVLLLVWFRKVSKAIDKNGKYIYKNNWLDLTITDKKIK